MIFRIVVITTNPSWLLDIMRYLRNLQPYYCPPLTEARLCNGSLVGQCLPILTTTYKEIFMAVAILTT